MKLNMADIQLGDTIEFYYNRNGVSEKVLPDIYAGTVIACPNEPTNPSYQYVVIGWKNMPTISMSAVRITSVSPDHWTTKYNLINDFGEYHYYHLVYFSYEICKISKGSPLAVSGRQEAPCRGCSAMNDLGVKTCWRCGGKNPTERKP
jgi:hypothetical protein